MIKGIDYIGIVVAALVYHPDKGILLGMRTENCRDEPHVRDNRGGGLKFGETLAGGLQRELQEELGLTFTPEQAHILGHREQFRQHDGKQTHWIAFYYLLILHGNESIVNAEPDKRSMLQFFPLHALPLREESHSVFYPTLGEFKEKIEGLIGKEIII